MRKTDASIKNIVTASISRHSIKIETWPKTQLWDALAPLVQQDILESADMASGELGIIAYYQNHANWYVITTRRIVFREGYEVTCVNIDDIEQWNCGDFKGVRNRSAIERMTLHLLDGRQVSFPFETGNYSMGPIYALRTLSAIVKASVLTS